MVINTIGIKAKRAINLLPLVLLIALTGSCSKDKGNYDYRELDLAAIDVTALPASYSLLQFDSLHIEPKVTFKGELVNMRRPQFDELEFSWEMYPAQVNSATVERHLIANTPALNARITDRQLVWELLYTVTNKNTGVKAFARFGVAVTPSIAEGWMVLYERDGNTDVGIIKNDEISKTATREEVFMDVYSASNNEPLSGKPGSLIFSIANFPSTKLYIQSANDIASVNLSTFERMATFNTGIFWSTPAVKSPALVRASEGRKEFIINNNKLHVLDYSIIAPGDRAFYDGLHGNYGQLAPWMAASTASAFDAILYDQTNKKFVKVPLRGSEVTDLATPQSTSAPFDVRNVGMELLMADLGWNNWEHMVMKDADGRYYLLTANFREGETAFIGKGKYDMSACPEIRDINSVTAGFYGEIFYYGANNHVYQFKYTPGITETLWTAPAGEVVTNISLQKYYNTNRASGVLFDPKNLCKILYIATYNESQKKGTVYQMQVNVSSGALLPGTEKKYSGFGKVKAMAWKPYIIR